MSLLKWPLGNLDVVGSVRATANSNEATGAGVEVRYDPAGTNYYGIVSSFDRGAAVYKPMAYWALTHTFTLSGTAVFGLSSGGGWFGASDPGGAQPLRVNGDAAIGANRTLYAGTSKMIAGGATYTQLYDGGGSLVAQLGSDGHSYYENTAHHWYDRTAAVQYGSIDGTVTTANVSPLTLNINGTVRRLQLKAGNTLGAGDLVAVMV